MPLGAAGAPEFFLGRYSLCLPVVVVVEGARPTIWSGANVVSWFATVFITFLTPPKVSCLYIRRTQLLTKTDMK